MSADVKESRYLQVAREAAEWRRAKKARIEAIETLLAVSPALKGISGRPPYAAPRLAIVSGELSDHDRGAYRVTFFGVDGPYGHATRRSMREIAEEIEDTVGEPYESMTDDDVMAWTSTPEFVRGAISVAYVQAENTYGWLSRQAKRSVDEWTRVMTRARNISNDEGMEAATAYLHQEIAALPKQNPRIAGFVMNPPPWVTGALASSYETLAKKVSPRWMPVISDLHARGRGFAGTFAEFGCGKYGCVLPTADASIVLKVTSDETEAMFADRVSPQLAARVCVEYPMVAELNVRHEGAKVYLLWRQAADHVGELDEVLGEYAGDMIDDQHDAGQRAYDALMMKKPKAMIQARVAIWLEACQRIANQHDVPALRPLFQGILQVHAQQRLLFGDIHTKNLGLVDGQWVITDPGNVAVLDPA